MIPPTVAAREWIIAKAVPGEHFESVGLGAREP
jgi:hypothetical protein